MKGNIDKLSPVQVQDTIVDLISILFKEMYDVSESTLTDRMKEIGRLIEHWSHSAQDQELDLAQVHIYEIYKECQDRIKSCKKLKLDIPNDILFKEQFLNKLLTLINDLRNEKELFS